MIRLNLLPMTAYGKTVMDFLLARESELHSECRPDESCLIEIIELPGQRFDAVVTMPRPVVNSGDWKAYAVVPGMYARRFDSGTTALEIHEAVAGIVGSRMWDRKTPAPSPDLRMVVVDSKMLRKAISRISGCEACSPLAQVPFESVLDRVSGNDPLATQYVIADDARCPRCRRRLHESTLVVFEPSE